MRRHDLDVCLLSNEPNVRYATGATAMPVYAMSTFARCVLVPQEERRSCSSTRTRCTARRSGRRTCARCTRGSFYDDPSVQAETWADVTLDAMAELGVPDGVIGVDRRRAGVPRVADRGAEIRDAAPATQEARRVKTAQELGLLDVNATLVMEMLAAFERAIAPG